MKTEYLRNCLSYRYGEKRTAKFKLGILTNISSLTSIHSALKCNVKNDVLGQSKKHAHTKKYDFISIPILQWNYDYGTITFAVWLEL